MLKTNNIQTNGFYSPFSRFWNSFWKSGVFYVALSLSGGSGSLWAADVTPPTVTLTNPTDGETVGGNVTLRATASDDVAVDRVAFYLDGALLHTDFNAAYSFSLNTNNLTDESHELYAVAYDTSENSAQSPAISVLVDNRDLSAPSVTITDPLPGATVSGGITIRATVSDSGGINAGVDRVEFRVNGVLKAIDYTSAYFYYWVTSEVDDLTDAVISVTAIDKSNNQTEKTVTVTVDNRDLVPPTVAFSDLQEGQTVSGSKTIFTQISDQGGLNSGIDRVEFRINGILKFTDTIASYSYSWDTTEVTDLADALVSVTAFDHSNNQTEKTVNVTVDNRDLIPPTITITQPSEGSIVNGSVSIFTTASDSGGVRAGIQKVDFYINGILKKTDTQAGYNYFWDSTELPPNSPATIRALATDFSGNTAEHEVSVVTGNPDVTDPFVSITAPVPNSVISGEVPFSATATDNVAVDRVEFLVNGHLIGTDDTAPYSVQWDSTSLPNKAQSLVAVAYDAAGNNATASIAVQTDNPDLNPPTVSITAPSQNARVAGPITLVAEATDDNGVRNVEFFVNGESLNVDFKPPFTALWDATELPRQSYTITAVATDLVGRVGQSAPVSVTVSDQEISPGLLLPSPVENAFILDSNPTQVSAGFEGVLPDLDLLTSTVLQDSLQVFCTQNGIRSRLSGAVSYSNGRLIFGGQIPDNCQVDWRVKVTDEQGRLLTGAFQFTRPAFPNRDVTVKAADQDFEIFLPAGSLPEPVFIDVEIGDEPAPISNALFNERAFEVIKGPYVINARNASGLRVMNLNAPAEARFQTPNAANPIDGINGVIQIVEVEEGTGSSRFESGLKSSAQASSVTMSINRLSTFQIISFSAAGGAISDFFGYPNPFNPTQRPITFHYLLGADSSVTLDIYDLFGNLAKQIQVGSGSQGGRVGQNLLPWDGRNGRGEIIANGGYLIRMRARGVDGSESEIKSKILVVK